LYGVHLLEYIPHGEVVVLTEGELDALVLQTLGFHAMSSTGGAGTWRQEWSELLQENHRVIIAYDADEAGVRGALKVASMTPLAAVAWLPVQFGKDPTEIVHNGGVEALIDSFSSARILLVPPDDAENRRDKLHELQQQLNGHRIETLNDRSLTPFHLHGSPKRFSPSFQIRQLPDHGTWATGVTRNVPGAIPFATSSR
jgi:DNA primase